MLSRLALSYFSIPITKQYICHNSSALPSYRYCPLSYFPHSSAAYTVCRHTLLNAVLHILPIIIKNNRKGFLPTTTIQQSSFIPLTILNR